MAKMHLRNYGRYFTRSILYKNDKKGYTTMQKPLKDVLRKRGLVIGSWITIGHPSIAEIMAHAGFNWLAIDMEHSAITLSEAQNLIQVIGLCGVTPLVRVGKNSALLIKQAMDAGAHGVIVPGVNTKRDAQNAVAAVNYPPKGTRGVGLARAQGYGMEFEGYKKWINNSSVVIVQIEHIDAIDALADILKVDGIDGTIIGPYDLSASMGFPGDFERHELKMAILKYENTCRRLKKPMGFHVIEPDYQTALRYKDKGYSFLAISLDTLYLGKKCLEITSRVKGWIKR